MCLKWKIDVVKNKEIIFYPNARQTWGSGSLEIYFNE